MKGRHTRSLSAPSGRWSRWGMVVFGGLAGAALGGSWWGAGAGLLLGAGCARWLARLPSSKQRAREQRLASELPFALDLVAAALRAGAPPDAAAGWAAEATGGVVGEHLRRVEHTLRSGGPAAAAWAELGGGVSARVARAAARSGHSGAALAGALRRVADDLRADAVQAAEARARMAGVLVVLPLGLCFLPAFVLSGLVPVIVAVVGGVLTAPPPP